MQFTSVFFGLLAAVSSVNAQSIVNGTSPNTNTGNGASVVATSNPTGAATTPVGGNTAGGTATTPVGGNTAGGSMTTAIVSSVSSGAPLPSGVQAIITLSTSNGGAFSCAGSIVFNANAAPTSGSLFSLMVDGTLSCNGGKIFISLTALAKRQTVSPIYFIGVSQVGVDPSTNAGFAVPTFTVVGTTITMFSNGITFGFGFVTGSTSLAAYDLSKAVPAGFTVVTLVATVVAGTPTTRAPLSTTTPGAAVGPTSTVTSTVTQVVNGVNVFVSIVIIISPLASPILVQQVIAISVNGVTYYISQNIGIGALTQTVSYNGVSFAAVAVVVVKIVGVVVPATQFITANGTVATLVGAISTVGTIITTQNIGAASTTTITVAPTAVVTATAAVTITAGAAVVLAGSSNGTAAAVSGGVNAGAVASAGAAAAGTGSNAASLPAAAKSSAGILGTSMLLAVPMIAAILL